MALPRTAVITGSSRGVGAACAELFADKGFNVVVNYSSSPAEAEQVATRCRAKQAGCGAATLLVHADLSTEAGCNALVDAAVARFGSLDVLVNNAGATKFVPHGDYGGLQANDFHRIYGLNVVVPFLLVRRAHAHLVRGGAVINVSSVAGLHGIGSSVAYGASKAALNALTLSLARSLGESRGVTVNSVCPGFIRTDWMRTGLGADYERAEATAEAISALGSTLGPEQVAEVVVALAGMPLTTGQLLAVDGGASLNVQAVPARLRARM